MKISKLLRLPSDGWRKTAVINTVIVGIFAIANLSTLIWSLTKNGLYENNIFRADECSKISLLNTFSHLLLNITSSLMIASSNFFMQVLNSPTRAEVDQAHARKRWLEIGVPSFRNVLNVSPLKSLAWALFSLSSLPIHLLFNSSIFSVDYSGSAWSMAIISESFLLGAPYSVPGAALVLEKTYCQSIPYNSAAKFQNYGSAPLMPDDEDGYDFYNSSQRLTGIVGTATQRLSVSDCKSEYQTCGGLRKYRNLLLVIDKGGEPTESPSWVLNDIYNMGETLGHVYNSRTFTDNKLNNETFSSMWGSYFRNASISHPNSLWFISKCYKMALPTSVGGCDNTCGGPLGIGDSMRDPINDKEVTNPEWVYPWWIVDSNTTWGPPWGTNNSDLWQFDAIYENGSWSYMCEGLPRPPYLNNSANSVRVQYCLAEPFEPGCELGISNLLLLMVTICVFTKLLLCAIVVSVLRDDPLVTPGDAVASFIRIPDPTTVGRCAATIPDIRSDLSNRKPVQWPERSKRFVHTASAATWARNYAFFCLLLIFLGFVMKAALLNYPISASSNIRSILSHEQSMLNGGVFEASWFPRGNFIASVMLPNTPQLILSCAYFAYNALYTRLLAESEWQSFSTSYRPLRVTHPQGEQWSTFRLQLPYRYSIPLLITSIVLHWITSNAIFLFMSKGGYYRSFDLEQTDSIVLVGYSSPAIIIGFTVSVALILLPLLLGATSLRGSMIISRSNSLIISAACHVSTLRNTYSPASVSKSMVRDKNGYDDSAGPMDNIDDWSRSTTAVISAIVEESIELQPLVSESCSSSSASSCSTIQPKQPHSSVPAKNILRKEAEASPENNPLVNAEATQHLLSPPPVFGASSNSANLDEDSRAGTQIGWDIEEQPLLSTGSTRRSITISRLSRNSITASDDTTVNAAQPVVAQGDVNTESRCLITSPHADGDNGRDTASCVDADGTDDRSAAVSRLEDSTNTEEDDMQFRTRLSKSRIRWGVVRMPDEFYAQFGDMEEGVELGHLSFGTEEQGVAPPVDDPWHLYA